jgi:hypothetical protein
MLDERRSAADGSEAGDAGIPARPGEGPARGPAGGLSEAIERHLLEAVLSRRQRATWQRHGWFELVWPEQYLVLRVHPQRPATVDAFQMSAWSTPGRCGADSPADTYLVSWDLDGAFAGDTLAAGPAVFRCPSPTPLAVARLVCEAHRRGVLRHLLEAGRSLRLAAPGA